MTDQHPYVAGEAWRSWANGETTGATPALPPITEAGMRDAVVALAAADHDDTEAGVDAALDKMFATGTDHDRLARVVTGILLASETELTVHHTEMLAVLAWFDGAPDAALALARKSRAIHGDRSTAFLYTVTAALLKAMPAPGSTATREETERVARHLLAGAN